MPLIPDKAAFQNSLASLPLVTSNKIRWRCSMLPLCWPTGSMARITLLFN